MTNSVDSLETARYGLCAQWVAKDPNFFYVDSKYSESVWADAQADGSLRLAHMPFCRFVVRWLIWEH